MQRSAFQISGMHCANCAARIEKKNQAAVAAERERMAEWLATYHHSAQEFSEEEKKKNQKPQ